MIQRVFGTYGGNVKAKIPTLRTHSSRGELFFLLLLRILHFVCLRNIERLHKFPLSDLPMGLPRCAGSAGCLEWVSLTCANAPPRNSHAAVLSGETMIIVGGASPEGQTDEVFTIDLADRLDLTCRKISCHPLEPSTGEANNPDVVGAVPTPREMHSACAFDSRGTEGTRATILIMGGRSADGVLRDLFSLDIGARHTHNLSKME